MKISIFIIQIRLLHFRSRDLLLNGRLLLDIVILSYIVLDCTKQID